MARAHIINFGEVTAQQQCVNKSLASAESVEVSGSERLWEQRAPWCTVTIWPDCRRLQGLGMQKGLHEYTLSRFFDQ